MRSYMNNEYNRFAIIFGMLLILTPFNVTLAYYIPMAFFWMLCVGLFFEAVDNILKDKRPDLFKLIFAMGVTLCMYASTNTYWLKYFPFLFGVLMIISSGEKKAKEDLKDTKKEVEVVRIDVDEILFIEIISVDDGRTLYNIRSLEDPIKSYNNDRLKAMGESLQKCFTIIMEKAEKEKLLDSTYITILI